MAVCRLPTALRLRGLGQCPEMTDFIVAPVSEGSIESIQSIQSEADPKGQALGKGHTGHTYWEFSKAFLKLTWPLLLGNTLEWYEFGIYSYVEKEIAANFFGGSAMGAWLGYAVTFVARPLGGGRVRNRRAFLILF